MFWIDQIKELNSIEMFWKDLKLQQVFRKWPVSRLALSTYVATSI